MFKAVVLIPGNNCLITKTLKHQNKDTTSTSYQKDMIKLINKYKYDVTQHGHVTTSQINQHQNQ